MTTTAVPRSASDARRAAEDLAPTIARRAPEIEAARRVPPDLLDQLVSAGCFRVLLPATHGGDELDLPDALRVFEALSRADASVGWTVAIGASIFVDLAGLPRATFDAVYANPDTIVAGAFNPSGFAVATDGGYRVRGRWGFASGCRHASWLYGNCVEERDGEASLRTVVLRPDEVRIEDTWHVSGLCGTGSHHFSVDDVVVPTERTFATMAHEPCLDAPAVRVPTPSLFALAVSTIAVGIAQGALDDAVELAGGKVPLLAAAPLADDPTFQLQLATADAGTRAARSLLQETAEEAWSAAVAGDELRPEQRARIRAAGVWATSQAADTVSTLHRLGGGSAVYLDNPLQRRLRDVFAVTQHFLVKPSTMVPAGALLAGREIELPVF